MQGFRTLSQLPLAHRLRGAHRAGAAVLPMMHRWQTLPPMRRPLRPAMPRWPLICLQGPPCLQAPHSPGLHARRACWQRWLLTLGAGRAAGADQVNGLGRLLQRQARLLTLIGSPGRPAETSELMTLLQGRSAPDAILVYLLCL